MSEEKVTRAAVVTGGSRGIGRAVCVALAKQAPENILVVGDTINDMNFAHNGGSIAVGVLSGVSSRKQLAPAADYILNSVADVPALIRQLEQKGL